MIALWGQVDAEIGDSVKRTAMIYCPEVLTAQLIYYQSEAS